MLFVAVMIVSELEPAVESLYIIYEGRYHLSYACRLRNYFWFFCPFFTKLWMLNTSVLSYLVLHPFQFTKLKVLKISNLICLLCYVLPIFISIPKNSATFVQPYIPLCHPYTRQNNAILRILSSVSVFLTLVISIISIQSMAIILNNMKTCKRRRTKAETIFMIKINSQTMISF